MSAKSILLFMLCWTVTAGPLASQSDAQNTYRRHRPLRWLGQGFSDGYNRCNPGYDTSYYNPYSAHNSFLYSQTPQYQRMVGTQNYHYGQSADLKFFGGVPFSVYSAPPTDQLVRGRFLNADEDNSFSPGNTNQDSRSDTVNEFRFELDEQAEEEPTPASQIPNEAQPAPQRDSGSETDEDQATAFRLPSLTGGTIAPPRVPAKERFRNTGFQK